MLKKVITTGTGRAARSLKRKDIGGKTRTSNRAVDTWFAGYHPDLVTVSWIGYDQPKPLAKKESGGTTALPMWINFMENTLIDLPETTLSRPAGIISLYINPKTGRVVDNNRKPSYLDKRLFSFRQGLAPRPTLKSITGKTIGELRAEELLLY
jgi:penicillin-binding protein 1A